MLCSEIRKVEDDAVGDKYRIFGEGDVCVIKLELPLVCMSFGFGHQFSKHFTSESILEIF